MAAFGIGRRRECPASLYELRRDHLSFDQRSNDKWRAERDSITPSAAVHGCGRPIAGRSRRNHGSGGLPAAIRWWRWDAARKGTACNRSNIVVVGVRMKRGGVRLRSPSYAVTTCHSTVGRMTSGAPKGTRSRRQQRSMAAADRSQAVHVGITDRAVCLQPSAGGGGTPRAERASNPVEQVQRLIRDWNMKKVARRKGLEPLTFWSVARCSIQLSYRRTPRKGILPQGPSRCKPGEILNYEF